MKAPIKQIKVAERIRKEITKIDELSADIEAYGLLNPITVMSLDGGEFQLLAGLRRLRAVERLGHDEIAVNVVAPVNAEARLRIEVSENEQREDFTFSEKMDFARLLEEIEKEKAKARMSLGGMGGREQEGADARPHLENKRSRDIVGEKIGMSGRQYSRAKHIAENAPEEVIDELDKGLRTIYKTYEEIRSKENAEKSSDTIVQSHSPEEAPPEAEPFAISDAEAAKPNPLPHKPEPRQSKPKPQPPKPEPQPPIPPQKPPSTAGLLSKADEEAIKRNKEFNALPPLEKIKELQRQLKEERARAVQAESELARLKELRHNDIYHKDGIIKNLEERLKDAEARVEELEGLNGKRE